jgi:hypothetical protein
VIINGTKDKTAIAVQRCQLQSYLVLRQTFPEAMK